MHQAENSAQAYSQPEIKKSSNKEAGFSFCHCLQTRYHAGSGLLSGFPDNTLPGQYPITVRVEDAYNNTADRNYSFVLDKGAPEVTVNAGGSIYWNYPFNISAEVVKHVSPTSAWAFDGTVAFYVNDQVVPGCEAVPYLNSYYLCSVNNNTLAVGTHNVRAEYTPTGWYADYYTSGSASKEFTVQPRYFVIQGYVYGDKNQNAIKDPDESTLSEDDWTINLDENCDGGGRLFDHYLLGWFLLLQYSF